MIMNSSSLGAVIVSVFLCGCSVSHIEPVLSQRPLVEPLPLSVGVYFSPEFRTYRHKCDAFLCAEYDLGSPSIALFETVLAGLFENTVTLASMPPAELGQKVSGVIVPAIVYFQPGQITYQVGFYSRTGVELNAWEIDGAASGHTSGAEQPRSAMRDAAAKFVKGFSQQPVILDWLKEAGLETKGTVSTAPSLQDNQGSQP